MATARPAARAASTASRTSATDVGRRTRCTRVALSWAWTSLTSISRSVIAEDSTASPTRLQGPTARRGRPRWLGTLGTLGPYPPRGEYGPRRDYRWLNLPPNRHAKI